MAKPIETRKGNFSKSEKLNSTLVGFVNHLGSDARKRVRKPASRVERLENLVDRGR